MPKNGKVMICTHRGQFVNHYSQCARLNDRSLLSELLNFPTRDLDALQDENGWVTAKIGIKFIPPLFRIYLGWI